MAVIGIIGAMELEVETLKANMQDCSVTEQAGMAFYQGVLSDAQVVVVQCGIGKVNAALCVQILADLFHVTHVINTGVAGSLDAGLDIGDIAISTDLMYHDFTVGPLGYAWGQVPGMDTHSFPADETLAELAQKLCRELGYHCRMGRVVSGDQFVASPEQKEQILTHVGGICTEMEGAAIAHAAYRNRLPVLVLRAISDKADHSAEMDYPTFERQAAERSAVLVQRLAAAVK